MKFEKCRIVPYSKSTRSTHLDHRIRLDNIANTLSCGVGGSSQSTSNFVKDVDRNGEKILRLLTVKETERLMFWPDNWTKYGLDEKNLIYEIPKMARYKACGNGIVSAVPKAILEKLIPEDLKVDIFSTFSGVDGSTMLLDKKRFNKIGLAEFDPNQKNQHAANILKFHYTNTPNLGDITKIKSEEIKPFNLMFASSPCQSFSSAGKRSGFGDIRGTLFSEVVRILKDHNECNFLFFENVKGLLDHNNGDTFLTILEAFSSIGFDLDFEVCNSKHFGVPQARERVYLFGRRSTISLEGESESININTEESNPKKIERLAIVERLKDRIRDNHLGIRLVNFNIPLSSKTKMKCMNSILEKGIMSTDEILSVTPVNSNHNVYKVIRDGVVWDDRITLKTTK